MIDGDGMVRGSYDIAERVERLGVTPGSTAQAVLFHFAAGRRVSANMVREAVAQLRRRRNLSPEGRAAVDALAATLAPAAPPRVAGTARAGVLLMPFVGASPDVRELSAAWRAGERAPREVVARAAAALANVTTAPWNAGDLTDARREVDDALGRKRNALPRERPLGGVDPRALPAGTPYPCADPYVGARVGGDDFAGTVLACATPPSGKRGRHFAVGAIASGTDIGRAWRSSARRHAARAAEEAELHYPSAHGLTFDETHIDNVMRGVVQYERPARRVVDEWLIAQNYSPVDTSLRHGGVRTTENHVIYSNAESELWMPTGWRYPGYLSPEPNYFGIGFVEILRGFVFVNTWKDYSPVERRRLGVWVADVRIKRENLGTIEQLADRLRAVYSARRALPDSYESRHERENMGQMYRRYDDATLRAYAARLAKSTEPHDALRRDAVRSVLKERRTARKPNGMRERPNGPKRNGLSPAVEDPARRAVSRFFSRAALTEADVDALRSMHDAIYRQTRDHVWENQHPEVAPRDAVRDARRAAVERRAATRTAWPPKAGSLDARIAAGAQRGVALRVVHYLRVLQDVAPEGTFPQDGEWADRKRNTVFARRSFRAEDQPRITRDHFDDPAVREAAGIAARTTSQQGYMVGDRYERPERIGQGNFGMVYRVPDATGSHAVKLPAAHDLHNAAWSREAQTSWIRHEAGVANELAARGYTIIPRGVYTEFGQGTPAFVREWGEPVQTLTPGQFATLERELLAIEREKGWTVADELLVLKRPDGSVFIADVGLWTPPSSAADRASWSSARSNAVELLAALLRNVPVMQHGVPHRPVLMPSLEIHARSVRGVVDDGEAPTAYDQRTAERLLAEIAERDLLGLPVPAEVRAAVPAALELLSR